MRFGVVWSFVHGPRVGECIVPVTMPPARLAHFKNRATSADTSSSDDQSPPPKRARDSPLLQVAERSVMAMTPPYDEKKVATSNVAPDHEKKSLRGKAPMDLDNACCRGNFDLSDLETLRCKICHYALFLPIYQVIPAFNCRLVI